MMNNIEAGKKIEYNVSYYNCGNAPDLFTNEVNKTKKDNSTKESKSNREAAIDTSLQSYGVKIDGNEKVVFYRRGDYPINSNSIIYFPKRKTPFERTTRITRYVYMISAGRLYYILNTEPKKN